MAETKVVMTFSECIEGLVSAEDLKVALSKFSEREVQGVFSKQIPADYYTEGYLKWIAESSGPMCLIAHFLAYNEEHYRSPIAQLSAANHYLTKDQVETAAILDKQPFDS